ncbi:MAG: ATP-dependent zinc metalloprotease FtsH [Planctomycetes bacterium]|nr:ATP-dependent zinc metalloprotease FtsH [Planctomycetota bacterium]
MDDQRDEGRRGERKGPRGGLPAVLIFLGILFGLVLLIEGFSGSGPQTQVDLDQFLRDLHSGSIESVELRGDLRILGKLARRDEAGHVIGRSEFSCDLPRGYLRQLDAELRDLVGRAPQRLGEEVLLTQLRDGSARPVKAWVVPQARTREDGAGEHLLVDVERPGQPRTRHWIVPDAGAAVDLRRADEALAPFGVPIERRQLPAEAATIRYEPENLLFTSLLVNVLPWVLFIGVIWFLVLRQFRGPNGAGGVLSFGRARANLVGKERTGVTFADVAGVEEAKEEVKEIVEFLKDPQRFSRIGARIPRGVLLVGPPGTGKTLLAKAIAGEADVPFFSISGSDFVEMFVGVGASRVRDLFRQAREKTPCLIFLDEIDAVGRRRGSGMGGGHDEREQTLNAILVEMDGFESDEGIILIAATNRPDVLDPALLRPGRFDRQIVIDLPDVKGREAIVAVHTRHVPLDADVKLDKVARATPGFSGAELASLVNEAALRATLLNRDRVNMADFEEARDRVRFGREKSGRTPDEKERRVTAYHEAGHALVGFLHPGVEPLHKVTIIPRGMSLGATMILPEKDRYQQRREQMLGTICFAFGGRLAEELFCGDVTSGAYDDIRKATDIARNMVTLFGMSEKLGPVNLAEREDAIFLGGEVVRNRAFSEATGQQIDAEIKRILDDCFAQARGMIEARRDALERIAAALMKYETIHGEEIAALVEGATPEEAHARFERSHPAPPPAKQRTPRVDSGAADAVRAPAPRREEGLPPAGEPVAP